MEGHRKEPWKLVDQEIPCPKCSQKFISKNDLKCHNDMRHTRCCYKCKTRFYSEQKWKHHNTKEHIFECEECDLRFTEETRWRRHIPKNHSMEPWKIDESDEPEEETEKKEI